MTTALLKTRPVFCSPRPGAAILGAGAALAQAETIDTDGDGMVSYTELLLVMPDMTEDDFAALDVNEDGMLDAEESRPPRRPG
jgi:hypothetical protein